MSGNGNDGTVNGATLGTNRHGQAGKAYQTNGNGFISVSDSPILDIDGQKSLTVSAWFKSSGNHRQFILQKKNINTIGTYRPGYFIDLNNQGSTHFVVSDSSSQESTPAKNVNLSDGKWYHVLAVLDRSNQQARLYIDGVVVDSQIATLGDLSNDGDLIIGRRTSAENLDGSIDDVRIYDRALSAEEISILYQLEKPKEALTDANFQTAVNLWFSDELNATMTYGHISDWNTSAVLYMSNAFENRTEFNQDISNWDVSSVRHMVGMFKGAVSFNQNIGNWDMGSATNLQGMFEGATSFNQDIGSWEVSKVRNMGSLFTMASSFNQDIGDWNTSSLTSASSMFSGASSFNQDIHLEHSKCNSNGKYVSQCHEF